VGPIEVFVPIGNVPPGGREGKATFEMNVIHTTTRRRRGPKVMRRTRSVGATGTAKAVGTLKASERQGCRRRMQGCMFQAVWTPPAIQGRMLRVAGQYRDVRIESPFEHPPYRAHWSLIQGSTRDRMNISHFFREIFTAQVQSFLYTDKKAKVVKKMFALSFLELILLRYWLELIRSAPPWLFPPLSGALSNFII
jgi:hypothetical protein